MSMYTPFEPPDTGNSTLEPPDAVLTPKAIKIDPLSPFWWLPVAFLASSTGVFFLVVEAPPNYRKKKTPVEGPHWRSFVPQSDSN